MILAPRSGRVIIEGIPNKDDRWIEKFFVFKVNPALVEDFDFERIPREWFDDTEPFGPAPMTPELRGLMDTLRRGSPRWLAFTHDRIRTAYALPPGVNRASPVALVAPVRPKKGRGNKRKKEKEVLLDRPDDSSEVGSLERAQKVQRTPVLRSRSQAQSPGLLARPVLIAVPAGGNRMASDNSAISAGDRALNDEVDSLTHRRRRRVLEEINTVTSGFSSLGLPPPLLFLVKHEVIRKTSYQRNINPETSYFGSRTGVKQDGIKARRENPKLGKNPNFGIMEFFEEAGGLGNIFLQGAGTHGSSTCGLTCRSTRCRRICNRSMLIDMWTVWCRSACNQPTNQTCGGRGVTLHDILIMLTTMWSTRCRRACNQSHAERHTGCHQLEVTTPVLSRRLEEFLFELRVVQGRPFRVRHAFEVPVTWKLDHGRRPGTPTFTFQHIHTTSDQFKNVRESRKRKQEVSIVFESFREFSRSYTTPVLDRRLQKFLFELRVVQGRTFRVRHASEVSRTGGYSRSSRKGFWSRIRARVKATTNQTHLPDQQCDTCVLGVTRQGRLRKHVPTQLGREFAARKVARVCPYSAGQRGCIKHALYGEVARKHAPSCDTILGLHVSSLDVLARVPLWLRVRCSGSRM
ncbi:hypothetical protein F2Q69_00042491 [Brassica cretica]|uniref:Uncharacterized protein n=1 Tax=Brassica cretica TaxID=69181 RepID=A0A8S9NGB6_BRACR|nr:hypothetical protein F2Q69_00042491 [Brassica cretica]